MQSLCVVEMFVLDNSEMAFDRQSHMILVHAFLQIRIIRLGLQWNRIVKKPKKHNK